MYRKIIILLCFAFWGKHVSAQGIIGGKITNGRGELVPFATVTLQKKGDSTLQNYTISDNDGNFAFRVDFGTYDVEVRSLGLITQKKSVTLSSKESKTKLDFILEDDVKLLESVEVYGEYSGIVFKGDTIQYDPNVFKDGSEQVLGDLLNQLPGIDVDDKGNVKAYGKDVDKILINGQDFFEGNTQMATKNLSADIAESVEVLNNYSEYSLLEGFASREQTAINIGVSKSKMGRISGNLSGGYAIKDKYNAKGDLMRLGSKSMISVLGSLNNTGEAVFSFRDYIRLQGGLNAVMSGGSSFSLSEDESRLLMPMSNIYENHNALSAINVSYNPTTKLKMNAYALFNGSSSKAEDLNNYTYNPDQPDVYTLEESLKSKVNSNFLTAYLKLNYNPSATLSLAYKGAISSSKMKKNNTVADQLSSQTMNVFENTKAPAIRTNHDLMLMKSLGKNLYLFYGKINYSQNPSIYDLQTDSLLLPIDIFAADEWYYLRQNRKTKQFSANISSAFLYRMGKDYFLRSTLGYNQDNTNYYTDIQDYMPGRDTYLTIDSLINDLQMNMANPYLQLDFVKNKGKFRFKLGLSANMYVFTGNLDSKSKKDDFFQLNPNIEISYHFSKSHSITMSYLREVKANSVSSFLEVPVFSNYRSYRSESALDYLTNLTDRVSLRYNFYDMFSNTMLNISGYYTKMAHNPSSNYMQSGALSESKVINSKDLDRYEGRLFFSKGLGFVPLFLDVSTSYASMSGYSQLWGLDNDVKTNTARLELMLESRTKYWLNFELKSSWDKTENKLSNLSVDQNQQRYGGKIKFSRKSLYADCEFQYVKNDWSSDNENLYVMNAEVRYDFTKKFSAFARGVNILNMDKQSWTTLSYANNYILERHYRQLPGYILLGIKCKF